MAGADAKRLGRSIVRSQRDVILEGGKNADLHVQTEESFARFR